MILYIFTRFLIKLQHSIIFPGFPEAVRPRNNHGMMTAYLV